jgi:hypothetical protein
MLLRQTTVNSLGLIKHSSMPSLCISSTCKASCGVAIETVEVLRQGVALYPSLWLRVDRRTVDSSIVVADVEALCGCLFYLTTKEEAPRSIAEVVDIP